MSKSTNELLFQFSCLIDNPRFSYQLSCSLKIEFRLNLMRIWDFLKLKGFVCFLLSYHHKELLIKRWLQSYSRLKHNFRLWLSINPCELFAIGRKKLEIDFKERSLSCCWTLSRFASRQLGSWLSNVLNFYDRMRSNKPCYTNSSKRKKITQSMNKLQSALVHRPGWQVNLIHKFNLLDLNYQLFRPF